MASRLISELPGEGTDASNVDLKRHLDDLQDHIQALKEQTASMVNPLDAVKGRRFFQLMVDGLVIPHVSCMV